MYKLNFTVFPRKTVNDTIQKTKIKNEGGGGTVMTAGGEGTCITNLTKFSSNYLENMLIYTNF